jgi:hypothetical protein
MIVEERVRSAEPAYPPAKKRWHSEGNKPERTRRGRVRRQRADGGALEDPAKRCAEHLISGKAISIVAHERMNEADNREARPGGVGDWCPATLSVPAVDPAGEVQAAYGFRARGKLHAARRHMEDIRSARGIEHVRPLEKTRKRLAVLAVADETEAGIWRNVVGDAAYVAAQASKREIF